MIGKTKKMLIALFAIFVVMTTTCFASEEGELLSSQTPAENASETVTTTEETGKKDEEASSTESTAPVETTGETTTESDIVNDDFYAIDQTVELSKMVDGNVYIMGKDVTISNLIGGDIFVMAENVTISSNTQIYGNAYILASNVKLDGVLWADLYAVCDQLSIAETGGVARDLRVASNKATIDGIVQRNVFLGVKELAVGEKAAIGGDLNYSAPTAVEVPSGVVKGTINYSQATLSENKSTNENTVLSYLTDCAFSLVYTLAIFGILLLVAPKFVKRTGEIAKKKSFQSFGIGLLVLIVPPILSVLLMFTVVGFPVAITLLAVWLFLLVALSFSITVIAFANLLAQKVPALGKARGLFAVILITLVLWGLMQIPFVAGFVSFVTHILGLGYIFYGGFSKKKEETIEVKE